MKKTQKEAVIECVEKVLGKKFVRYNTDAALLLKSSQLTEVVNMVVDGVLKGEIEYGLSTNDRSEVESYVRKIVIGFIRNASELNGNAKVSRNIASALKHFDMSILPKELKEIAKALIPS